MKKSTKSILKFVFDWRVIGLTIVIAVIFLYFGIHIDTAPCKIPSYPEGLSRVIGPCSLLPRQSFNMILVPFLYIADQLDQTGELTSYIFIPLLIGQLLYFFLIGHILKFIIMLILELSKKVKTTTGHQS